MSWQSASYEQTTYFKSDRRIQHVRVHCNVCNVQTQSLTKILGLLPPGSEITAIELGVAMLTACLPAYLPLIRYARYGPRALTRETTPASVSSKTGMTKLNVGSKLNPFKSRSPRQSSTSADSYAYSGSNRVQTQVEGRALGKDELSALEDQYGLNGRIIVTRSVATESHSSTP